MVTPMVTPGGPTPLNAASARARDMAPDWPRKQTRRQLGAGEEAELALTGPGAVRQLLWQDGIDTCLVVGLDGRSRVVFHDTGDA